MDPAEQAPENLQASGPHEEFWRPMPNTFAFRPQSTLLPPTHHRGDVTAPEPPLDDGVPDRGHGIVRVPQPLNELVVTASHVRPSGMRAALKSGKDLENLLQTAEQNPLTHPARNDLLTAEVHSVIAGRSVSLVEYALIQNRPDLLTRLSKLKGEDGISLASQIRARQGNGLLGHAVAEQNVKLVQAFCKGAIKSKEDKELLLAQAKPVADETRSLSHHAMANGSPSIVATLIRTMDKAGMSPQQIKAAFGHDSVQRGALSNQPQNIRALYEGLEALCMRDWEKDLLEATGQVFGKGNSGPECLHVIFELLKKINFAETDILQRWSTHFAYSDGVQIVPNIVTQSTLGSPAEIHAFVTEIAHMNWGDVLTTLMKETNKRGDVVLNHTPHSWMNGGVAILLDAIKDNHLVREDVVKHILSLDRLLYFVGYPPKDNLIVKYFTALAGLDLTADAWEELLTRQSFSRNPPLAVLMQTTRKSRPLMEFFKGLEIARMDVDALVQRMIAPGTSIELEPRERSASFRKSLFAELGADADRQFEIVESMRTAQREKLPYVYRDGFDRNFKCARTSGDANEESPLLKEYIQWMFDGSEVTSRTNLLHALAKEQALPQLVMDEVLSSKNQLLKALFEPEFYPEIPKIVEALTKKARDLDPKQSRQLYNTLSSAQGVIGNSTNYEAFKVAVPEDYQKFKALKQVLKNAQ
ncbi:hypothetical protein [Variovorax saccharolyticus]|uniref:hypothetical protein n=1 Tax=Variovorax saccharolyticus TaxID=3053516 RepID=UPI0025769B86|nr:hypothetical protein [Variovorax sp. J31P216]MDM0029931.1 hypothetical protein [Variovorax sp. J31P216]